MSSETPPTFFEVTTAIAFEQFARAGVDVAVLEVGLGGRLDSTNVVHPVAAAITSIDFDHQQYLGTTLAAIAAEKAGVIRPGIPVVVGAVQREARDVLVSACDSAGAHLIEADTGVTLKSRTEDGRTSLQIGTPARDYPWVRLGLRGDHQVGNALVAVRLLEALEHDAAADGGCDSRRSFVTCDGRVVFRCSKLRAAAGCCSTQHTIQRVLARSPPTCGTNFPNRCRSCSARFRTRTPR